MRVGVRVIIIIIVVIVIVMAVGVAAVAAAVATAVTAAVAAAVAAAIAAVVAASVSGSTTVGGGAAISVRVTVGGGGAVGGSSLGRAGERRDAAHTPVAKGEGRLVRGDSRNPVSTDRLELSCVGGNSKDGSNRKFHCKYSDNFVLISQRSPGNKSSDN